MSSPAHDGAAPLIHTMDRRAPVARFGRVRGLQEMHTTLHLGREIFLVLGHGGGEGLKQPTPTYIIIEWHDSLCWPCA